jgi:hypothetical protein
MRARRDVVLFAGPTLAASPVARRALRGSGVRVRAPVARGDVTRLVEAHSRDARGRARHRPGVIVVVDGLFHDRLAVGHAELRGALRAGWRVWGLSSMGAIRAREMAPLGMRGFGRVFERFAGEGDFQDDEVALLHGPAPEYRAVSEPLVHLRAAAEHLASRGVLSAAAAADAIASLKGRWYGERTRRAAFEAFAARATSAAGARGGASGPALVRNELADFRPFELKTLDLEQFVQCRPWTDD